MKYYIPFGDRCDVADILKAGGLRNQSLPFDWVFAFPHLIKRSLDTHFEEWFDVSCMTITRGDSWISTKHSLYDLGWGGEREGFFNHHDMSDPDTQAMYRRRIDRFYNIINSNEDVYLVSSASIKDLKNNGLLNYFPNTKLINIKWVESEHYDLKVNKYDEYVQIEYSSPMKLSKDIANIIGEVIANDHHIQAL